MAKKMFWAIVAVVIGAGLLFAGKISDNATDIRQAQAAIEAARAAQGAAKAAEVAGRGLATVSSTLAFILGGIVFSALAIIGVTLYLRVREWGRGREGAGKWAPGPNAQFRRTDVEKKYAPLPPGDSINQLMQLLVLQQLKNLTPQPPSRDGKGEYVEALGPVEDEGEDYLWQ